MEYILITLVALNVLQGSYLVAKTGISRAARRQNPIFIDTSVLIDGRIQAVAETGFVQGEFLIPRSVIAELQFMADNADGDKRARARHGLDVATALQNSRQANVSLHHDTRSPKEGVDNQLLILAQKYNGSICTIDFNLNKVAQVEGIRVLNINELAKQLRSAYLPGETAKVHLSQKGNDAHQAIGHLEDGTMVVVEQASNLVGTVAEVEFIRSLQTAAGRMMFAKVASPTAKVRQDKPQQQILRKSKQAAKGKKQGNTGTGRSHVSRNTHESTVPNMQRDSKGGDTTAARKPKSRRTNEDRLVELANQ